MDSPPPGIVVLAVSVSDAGAVDRNVGFGTGCPVAAGIEKSAIVCGMEIGTKFCGTRNIPNGVRKLKAGTEFTVDGCRATDRGWLRGSAR